MPKSTDISSILPSPPSGGEGKLRGAKQGEGGVNKSGPVLAERNQDHSSNSFGVFENVAVGEANDFVALAFHESRARRVIGFPSGVAVAVQFDDQLVFSRGEVGSVIRAKDHLADEFYPLQPAAAQDRPELFFGWRHFGAKLLGTFPVGNVALGQSTPPSPWRRFASPFPLPLKGAREFGNASHHA